MMAAPPSPQELQNLLLQAEAMEAQHKKLLEDNKKRAEMLLLGLRSHSVDSVSSSRDV